MADTATSTTRDITLLDLDHPGANDAAYRVRRAEIAAVARRHRQEGGEMPDIAYTEEEHETWRTAVTRLNELHEKNASAAYLAAKRALRISPDRIPQLNELNDRLAAFGGFRLSPVEGFIDSRTFLSTHERDTMLCTQYIRHASRPEYTPEPDVIHELVGHAPTFIDSDFVAFTRRIGQAAAIADAAGLTALERLYWFTVEFGLIRENGKLKAFGAGLLSSFGEIEYCLAGEVERREFQLEEVLATPYEPTAMQPKLFIIPSFAALKEETARFLRSSGI
jgi:phenylalanine-4-hydroxylase